MGFRITCLILWAVLGPIICIVWDAGWELCNPYRVYQYYEGVNVFGAIMISLLYTALCPIGALCYWFYKLCTVGR